MLTKIFGTLLRANMKVNDKMTRLFIKLDRRFRKYKVEDIYYVSEVKIVPKNKSL